MVRSINPVELGRQLRRGSPVLAEALSADFHDAGHLPGAVSLPLSSTDAEITDFVMSNPEASIVVYGSRDGGEAVALAERIIRLGHADVVVLDGGKEGWVEAGHVLERRSGD